MARLASAVSPSALTSICQVGVNIKGGLNVKAMVDVITGSGKSTVIGASAKANVGGVGVVGIKEIIERVAVAIPGVLSCSLVIQAVFISV